MVEGPMRPNELIGRLEEVSTTDYKFLVTSTGKVFVANEVTTGKTFSHKEWEATLRLLRLIGENEEVKGGYLVRTGNKLQYWGDSDTIPGATQQELFAALAQNQVMIVSAQY